MPYKLSATLLSHSADVRGVVSPTDNLVLSASRDSTAISWLRSSPSSFSPASLLRSGSRFVNAVEYLPPTADASQGYAVVGGQDMVINIFMLDSSNKEDPDYSLIGHTDNVCALHVGPAGIIISGSWDRTAKVWKNFLLQYDLKGHQQSVWAVLALEDSHFLTASADKTIKLWMQNKAIRTYEGHRDAVRGLALIPDLGFASCSNDSEVRVWTMGGDLIYTLSGHTSFVYSLSVLPNGDLVSAGEDRSVRIWRDGECAQVIIHPAISVWSVATMPNSDIVSGCSDGVVRVFSKSEDRWAGEADRKVLEDQISNQVLSSQQIGDVKKTDLPGPEALVAPGKKAGEVKMVRSRDTVEAHQWDATSSSWQKIGEVVDAVGSGRKQLYNGKEYDYVFDVDVQEGAAPLKLPYNASENPYAAAQRFLQQNDVSMNYIDEVVRFIEKNTAGVNLGSDSDYVDPFTGASRYQPSTRPSSSTVPTSTHVDPFTGASRYSGTLHEVSPPATQTPQTKILPFKTLVTFKQSNIPAMRAKLYQFDDALRNETTTAACAMYPEEQVLIEEVFTFLSQITSNPASPTSITPSGPHIEAIISILNRWPAVQRFPVMDLGRLVAVYCASTPVAPGNRENFFDCLFNASDWSSVASRESSMLKPQETNVLLLLRTITNYFQEGTPVNDGQWVQQIFEALSQAPYHLLSKPQRVALASILFNFSCIHLNTTASTATRDQCLSLIFKVLKLETDDPEVTYRTSVALGNILYEARDRGMALNLKSAQVMELKDVMRAIRSSFNDGRINNVIQEINSLAA
ncbi:WD40-repeat-containing domain protein [Boletus reticuloceps]|uniref:WD40-repeat-containing domain protein n=1 Tax=Boletus reticuloceps TaxID=495285 RepID=A0A8I2YQI2_9AGAM|nr:WD40-repeat-containing domain protein [Boletus reticuloceps]